MAVLLHQEFKWQFVSRFPKEGFTMSAEEVQEWAKKQVEKLDLSAWEEDEPVDESV